MMSRSLSYLSKQHLQTMRQVLSGPEMTNKTLALLGGQSLATTHLHLAVIGTEKAKVTLDQVGFPTI